MKRLPVLALVVACMAAAARAQEAAPPGPADEVKATSRPASAGELSDPVEILKKVDAAARAVESVKYEAELVGLEAAEPLVGKLRALIIATGTPEEGFVPTPTKYWVDAKFQPPGSDETMHLAGGTDGETYVLVNHVTKMAYEDMDPAVLGSGARVLAGGMMFELLFKTPFTDEINGVSHKLLGSKVIGGVDCYEIHIVYQGNARSQRPEATWCFGKKDLLPRRRVDKFTLQDGRTGLVQKTIMKLEIDPKLEKDTFKPKLPEGYTKSDDFAP